MSSRVACLPAALAAALVLWVVPGAPATAAGKRLAVARVTGVTGQHRFYVKRHARLVRLHAGDRVFVGELVVLGARSRATLRLLLTKRSRVADNADVLDVARFPTGKLPSARRITKQYGLLGHAAKTRRHLVIAPRLLQIGP